MSYLVRDGTPEAELRVVRCLTNDPGLGVARHVDAGYEEAWRMAVRHGLKIPMEPVP